MRSLVLAVTLCLLLASPLVGQTQAPTLTELERLKVPGAEGLCAPAVSTDEDGTRTGGDFLRLWPHRHGTDGFFAAVWTRK